MVISLERGLDLHTAQLMPLPLTVSCFSKNQTGFTFLILAHPGSPGKRPLNGRVFQWEVPLFLEVPEFPYNTVHIWRQDLQHLLPDPNALVAISKGMRAVKLCTHKILQFLTGGAG